MASAPKSLNTHDFLKVAQAFFYNALSLSAAIALALTQIPAETLPPAFVWIVASAPVINAVAYAVVRWLQDNRKNV